MDRCTNTVLREGFGIESETLVMNPLQVCAVLKANGLTYRNLWIEKMGLADFINAHQTGKFIIFSNGHCMGLIDGKLIDTMNYNANNRVKIWSAYEVK